MKVLPRGLYWLLTGGNLLAAVGASGAFSADLAIYDLTKSVVINVSSNRFREIVLDASPRRSTFLTLTRLREPKLIMRERNADGKLLSEVELPIFHSGYAWPEWIKLSPDRKRAIFWSSSTKGLSLLSLQGFREKELMRDLCRSDTFIVLMRWLNENTVLVVVYDPLPSEGPVRVDTRTETGRIVKINVDSCKAEILPYAVGSSCLDHALTDWGEILAIAGWKPGERVKLLNVRTMKVVKELAPVSRDQWIRDVSWVDEGKSLCFWNVADAVYLYCMGTGETKRLTPAKDRTFFLHGSAGGYVVLRQHTGEARTRPRFFLHDVTTGKRTALDAPINGRVYSIAQHTRLVMEVGY